MAPRTPQHGAPATARRTSASQAKRPASTSRTPSSSPSKRVPEREAATRVWWVLPLSILAVIAVFVWTFYPVARVQYREVRERERLERELAALEQRNERLARDVARLKTPEGVEDYARTQLGLVKQGEHQVVVVDGNETLTATPARPVIDSDEAPTDPVGPWTAFLDAVFQVQ